MRPVCISLPLSLLLPSLCLILCFPVGVQLLTLLHHLSHLLLGFLLFFEVFGVSVWVFAHGFAPSLYLSIIALELDILLIVYGQVLRILLVFLLLLLLLIRLLSLSEAHLLFNL